jgi:hypothetical protein
MKCGKYIWQYARRPDWKYNSNQLAGILTQVHHTQGHLLGRMHDLCLPLREQATV